MMSFLYIVVKRLKVKEVPDLDGFPNVVLQIAILAFPNMRGIMLQKSLDNSYITDICKIQKFVLLPKPGETPGDLSIDMPAGYYWKAFGASNSEQAGEVHEKRVRVPGREIDIVYGPDGYCECGERVKASEKKR